MINHSAHGEALDTSLSHINVVQNSSSRILERTNPNCRSEHGAVLFPIAQIYSAARFHANRIDCITRQVYLIKVPPRLWDAITKLNTIRHGKCCRRELLLCKPDRSVSHLAAFPLHTERSEDAALISSFKKTGSTLISRLFNLIKNEELDLSHR